MGETTTKKRSNKKAVSEKMSSEGNGRSASLSTPTTDKTGPFYTAGPSISLMKAAQAKLVIGQANDPYEQEADTLAERVVHGGAAPAISRLQPGSLEAFSENEEPTQTKEEESVQTQTEDEEPVQAQAESESESIQTQVEDEETVQTQQKDEEPIQSQVADEETVQTQAETEEPVQAQGEDEDPVQAQVEDEEPVQTQADDEEPIQSQGEAEEPVQSKPGNNQDMVTTAVTTAAIRNPGIGQPLEPAVRQRVEPYAQADLSSVRVHTDQTAQMAAATLAARAFTHRQHIFLAADESPDDLALMAHEITHVIQQDGLTSRLPVADTTEVDDSATTEDLPEETSTLPVMALVALTMIMDLTAPQEAGEGETAVTPETDEAEPEADVESGEAPAETEEVTPNEEEALDSDAVAEAAAATEAAEAERMAGVMERLDGAATQQEGPAASSSSQAQASQGAATAASAASPSPANEADAMGQAGQVNTMNEQEAGEVDQQNFLSLVRQKLAEVDLPDNPKEMDEFSDSDGASGLREEVMGGVTTQTETAQGDIRQATEAETTPAEAREAAPLSESPSPGNIPPLQAEEVLPQPRSDETVYLPLEANLQQVDTQLAEAKAQEDRLEREKDPSYAAVADAQQEIHDHVENSPEGYREEEATLLTEQEAAIAPEEATTTEAMEQARAEADQTLGNDQQEAMSAEELERQQVSDHIEGIFSATQQEVQDKLTWLDEQVDQQFTEGEARAKERFESYVDDGMSDWKWERYGGRAIIPIVGAALAAGTWLYDQLVGIDQFPEIIAIFENGREQYLAELDGVIVEISNLVDETLAWCQERIQQGQTEIDEYVQGLPESLRQVGEETAASVSGRFDELRNSVENHREELANRLVERYQESREALDARIAELHAENNGLVDEITEMVDSVMDAINSFRELLPNLARNVPGYTMFTVIIGFDPLAMADVERNAVNLLGGLMGMVPFGTMIFDTLQERGVIDEAFQWVESELERLNLSRARIDETIDAAWEDIQITAGVSYNLEVLERHFGQLLEDVTTFALSLVDYLIELIKNTALDIADDLLAENQAWSLIKKVLHHDPLRDEPVDASTAEIIEDFLLLIGKEQELEQMREQGTVEETAVWIDTQLETLFSLLGELGGLFSEAWETIQPENLPNLMSNLEGLAQRAISFLGNVWDFALVVGAKVFEIIKDALLAWMQSHAGAIPGYHLLTVILEKDVFTQEEVPRTPTNLIRGFMSLAPGGEQQFQQMQESGVIPQAAQRIESMMSDLGISWPFIRDLFIGIWDSLSIDDLTDPFGAFTRIIDQFGEPLGRLFTFVIEVIKVVLELILRMMGFPFELIGSIITNAMQAFEDITSDPVGFLMNMLQAVKLGFSNFFDNILTHLMGGLADWLFGGLREAGVEPPADLSLSSILDFVLDVLGISMDRIWEKLAERIGQENVDRIRGALDMLEGIWTFVRDVQERGVVAIWEYIESQISNLWSMLLEKALAWIMEKIIVQVTARLLSMLDPTGVMAVINSFLVFFNAVQSVIQYIHDILEIINDYVTTIAAVARGDIEPGAQKMEQGFANAIPVAIGFLANQVGLGNIADKMAEIIGGVREMIDAALDWLFDLAEQALQSLMRMLGFGGEDEEESEDEEGVPEDIEWWEDEEPITDAADAPHRLLFRGEGSSATLIVRSDEHVVSDWLVAQRESAPEATRPLFEEASRSYNSFVEAKNGLEARRAAYETSSPADQVAQRPEIETLYQTYRSSLRTLGRSFTALPLGGEPDQIELTLPPQKDATLYSGYLSSPTLQHSLNRAQRNTNQISIWESDIRSGMSPEAADLGRQLVNLNENLSESRILRPNWDKVGRGMSMQVDHKVEWQVRPVGGDALFDDVSNMELLDSRSNQASGSAIHTNIQNTRQNLADDTGDQSWLFRDLTFTAVTGGGSDGNRWSDEEIKRGDHLRIYNNRIAEIPVSETLPSPEEVLEARSAGESTTAQGIEQRATLDSTIRMLEDRYPDDAANIRRFIDYRMNGTSYDSIRASLGITAGELTFIRSVVAEAGISV